MRKCGDLMFQVRSHAPSWENHIQGECSIIVFDPGLKFRFRITYIFGDFGLKRNNLIRLINLL